MASNEPIVIVSCDSHAGPKLKEQLRDYCPQKYLDEFDAFVEREEARAAPMIGSRLQHPNIERAGHYDPDARLADMDADGVAAELIWHFSQNGENLPWIGIGLGTVLKSQFELGTVAYDIYNRWLADFCATDPERLLGLVYIPTWDIDASIATLEWARERGLRCVNFGAPGRPGVKEYNHLDWDPFWSACTGLGFTLSTHSSGGPLFDFSGGPGMLPIIAYEGGSFMSRRAVWILTFGEVFERHPDLKLVITEQVEGWYVPTMRELDSFDTSNSRSGLPMRPSEYVRRNVFLGASFISQWQAQDAVAEGYVDNVMWGRDYPHVEGVFQATRADDEEPMTRVALRHVFHTVSSDAAAKMLGENAMRVFGLNEPYLREVATRIGALTLADLAVAPESLPPNDGLGFVGQSGPRPLEPERLEHAERRKQRVERGMNVDDAVTRWKLAPHPEGGFFRETYRCALTATPAGWPDARAFATSILYLLPAGVRAARHRLRGDELWLWQGGAPMALDIEGATHLVGPEHELQVVVPGGAWQSATPAADDWSLVGCVVAPGFDFADFEME